MRLTQSPRELSSSVSRIRCAELARLWLNPIMSIGSRSHPRGHPGVSRAVKNGLGGTRLDPLRGHHRWLGALSYTPQGGVREGPASNLPVSYCRRGGESGGGGGGQRSQGPGSPTT